MKVIKNFFWNAGYQVFALLVPLITVPYINRTLGPTGVGINAFTNSVVQYFVLFGSLGINLYGNRGTAYRRDDKVGLTIYFWEVTILRIIAIGVAVIAYLIFVSVVDRYRIFYLAQGLLLIAGALDISWFFQGLENFRVTVVRNVMVKIASIILIFMLIRRTEDTALYIVIIAGSQLVGNLTFWPSLHRTLGSFPQMSSLHIWKHVQPAFFLLVPQLATQIYLQLNKTMLGILQGVIASGFYENSDKIVKMLLAVVTATGTVLLPHVSHYFAKGDHLAVKHSLETSMHVILAIAIPLAFGIAAVSTPFTFYFFSAKFMPVAPLMAVESIVVIPISIASAIGLQYLLPTNQIKPYTTSVLLGSFANIIVNVPFILWLGTMGAVLGTIVSEVVVTAYQIYAVRKQVSLRGLFNETWKYFLSGLVMFIVIRVFGEIVGLSLIWLVYEVLIGVLTYVFCLSVLRPTTLLFYINPYINKLKKRFK
ncbi:oligosaccharide flippase family protein [Lacticaseibacillus chiayiensis]|uniref:oligosaccharide flippase family protein n=1 Tax=Lacticaseibacillus chiayiensis TaxID=2100821 RepID=UPI0010110158|nr:oligosaccharide flippase family protein [Lacticaseibacillus chiayiensis]QVI33928.1 oligosaccharide flippase family protein [Lacticaseibacillus chiayiensis]RXT58114.1 flippase [Lacticaseibacillus chiayiensis]